MNITEEVRLKIECHSNERRKEEIKKNGKEKIKKRKLVNFIK